MNNNITNENIAKALCYVRHQKRKVPFEIIGSTVPWGMIQKLIVDNGATIGVLRDHGVSEDILLLLEKYTFNNEYFHFSYYENLMKELKKEHQDILLKEIATANETNRKKLLEELVQLDYKYMVKVNFKHCPINQMFVDLENPNTPWFSDGMNEICGCFKKLTATAIVCPVNTGKSTYMASQAARIAQNGTKVLYLFNEMTQPVIEKQIYGCFQNTQIKDESSIDLETYNKYVSLIDVDKVPVRKNVQQAVEDTIVRIMSSDAEIVILDYLQMSTGSGSFETSDAYNDYVQGITEFIEDETLNVNKTSFLFTIQANSSTQHPEYVERLQMDTKAKGCGTVHQHLDCFVGMAHLSGDENFEEIIDNWKKGTATAYRNVVIKKKNIRCFTILKGRDKAGDHKSYTVYQYFNGAENKTFTIGISRSCTTSDGYTYPMYLQCGYDETGKFWFKDKPWTDVKINLEEANPVDMEDGIIV